MRVALKILISGIRDDTPQPACGLAKCRKEGKISLRSQGLIDPSVITAREDVVGGNECKLPVQRKLGARFQEDPVQDRWKHEPLPSVRVWW